MYSKPVMPTLDRLLEVSRGKFLNRSMDVRRESLEQLWDAWERLKTLEPGRDKRENSRLLLDKVTSEPALRTRLRTGSARTDRHRQRVHDPSHRNRQAPDRGTRACRLSISPHVFNDPTSAQSQRSRHLTAKSPAHGYPHALVRFPQCWTAECWTFGSSGRSRQREVPVHIKSLRCNLSGRLIPLGPTQLIGFNIEHRVHPLLGTCN